MKKIANVLLVVGILVLLYPLLDQTYTWYWQRKIFNEWETGLLDEGRSGQEKGSIPDGEPAETGEDGETADPFWGLEIEPLGILEIEKIDLKIPVLKGASLANLKIGAGLSEDAAAIEEPGNTVLTAHRSYTYGRFFNRLDEIDTGDKISIATREQIFCYEVFSKVVVKPDEISSVINGDEKENVLTLVTCHPVHPANLRLIVQCRVIGQDEEKGETFVSFTE